MNRSQDNVIEDDEETCPLCIEEFDLSDKNFRPCPCGYQICQFCFNSLKNTYEKSTCPNCRRPYDEKTIQYKIPTAEEFKLDQLNKNKKQAAAKRKETEKREVENSSRRNLAGVRVKQQNLVYVIGLIPSIKDEQALLQTLRGPEFFGQYGDIEKIVVSKAKPGAANQGIGVYVTYARKEDAALCISTVDGSLNGDRVLRAQFGTTKYCSAYLRNEVCNNKSCSFLHESGEDGQSSSLQNEPHGAKLSTKPPTTTQTAAIAVPPRPLSGASLTQPMARSNSKDEGLSRKSSHDGSALPSTASWANINAPIARTRRASQANSRATPSPQLTHTLLAGHKTEDHKPKESAPIAQSSIAEAPKKASPKPESPVSKPKPKHVDPIQEQYDYVLRTVSQNYAFVYDDSCLSPEVRAQVETMPSFIDPFGGAKRRAMREREEAERAKIEADTRAKLEAQAISSAEETLDEDNMAAGSLALGGEPEDDPRSLSARGAIGRPSQPLSDQFTNMTLNPRSLTPQQRQQLSQQSSGLAQTVSRNTAFDMSDFDRREPQYSQAQFEQINSHQRHGSRYFNNDSKSASGNRFQSQQQSFYSSGVQGPPPGLPTAGTPPVSGGGMFAHGQNFTNPGFGTSKDTNAEIYSIRNRSGTNQGHDISKRGGVEHLADPSIVQARAQQGNSTGQGLFGSNQVDEKNFPPLPTRMDTANSALHSRVSSFHSLHSSGLRSSTPKIPPGFELTHAHPVQTSRQASPVTNLNSTQRSISTTSATIAPAVPLIPVAPRTSTPKPKTLETPKVLLKETKSDDVFTTPAEAKGEESDVAKISFGSPRPRASRPKVGDKDQKLEAAGQAASGDGQNSAISNKDEGKGKQNSLIPKPDRIEIPPAAEKVGTPILGSAIVETPGTQSSRPATPAATTPSESSKASIARPRTLRLTTGMISKASEPNPLSATTEKSSVMPPTPATKRGSRRPSISSIQHSRPSTPALSELLSHDVSRASSPPPSIVGSAVERGKSKSQQKKERRDKAKKPTEQGESASSASVSAQPSVEEVAPVIARQKKQKRRVESNAAASTEEMTKSTSRASIEPGNVQPAPTKLQSSAIEKEAIIATSSKKHNSTKAEEKEKTTAVSQKAGKTSPPIQKPSSPMPSAPKEESSTPGVVKMEDTVKTPYTLRDLYTEVGKLTGANAAPAETSASVQKLLNDHISPMSKLISSMIQSGDLAKDHPWLNPTSFNSAAFKLPPDSRRAQEYLDGNGYSATDAFGYVYLPLKEKHALKEGHCVSVADGGDKKDDLLKKCLITSNGWVLRHLSGEETRKVIDLNERRPMYLDEFGEVGTMDGLGPLEHDDFSNLAGGMEHLSRYGEQHGVVWVVGEGEQADLADDDDDEFEIFEDEDAEIDGEIGIPSDDEEFEILHDDNMEPIPTSVREGLGGLNVPPGGAWDLPPPITSQHPHLGRQSRQTSLPGLGPHSKTNVFARAKNLGLSPTSTAATIATATSNLSGDKNGHSHHAHGAQSSSTSASQGDALTTTNASRQSSSVGASASGLSTHINHTPVNLRALDSEALARRVTEKQKELELSRKEMEKMEKLWNKKSKDIGRWREGLVKA